MSTVIVRRRRHGEYLVIRSASILECVRSPGSRNERRVSNLTILHDIISTCRLNNALSIFFQRNKNKLQAHSPIHKLISLVPTTLSPLSHPFVALSLRSVPHPVHLGLVIPSHHVHPIHPGHTHMIRHSHAHTTHADGYPTHVHTFHPTHPTHTPHRIHPPHGTYHTHHPSRPNHHLVRAGRSSSSTSASDTERYAPAYTHHTHVRVHTHTWIHAHAHPHPWVVHVHVHRTHTHAHAHTCWIHTHPSYHTHVGVHTHWHHAHSHPALGVTHVVVHVVVATMKLMLVASHTTTTTTPTPTNRRLGPQRVYLWGTGHHIPRRYTHSRYLRTNPSQLPNPRFPSFFLPSHRSLRLDTNINNVGRIRIAIRKHTYPPSS
ncbi:hypothetical protein PILCRDRAFT_479395 [Piloderma croceum F 1598]|uniref:Uncharacterized protein n=1 Tax=Piloderma croceum (strain F 1598) TaxID=765440 RepID=A0A0C3FQD7_PILCF|nr:hypothetical protein PILCRDRAFT_479395 [Piloderma croceum F 1598]